MVSCNGVGLLRAVLLLLSPHSWVTSAHATTRAMQSVKSKGRHTQGLWGHVQENESKGGWKTLGNLEVIPRLARILLHITDKTRLPSALSLVCRPCGYLAVLLVERDTRLSDTC